MQNIYLIYKLQPFTLTKKTISSLLKSQYLSLGILSVCGSYELGSPVQSPY